MFFCAEVMELHNRKQIISTRRLFDGDKEGGPTVRKHLSSILPRNGQLSFWIERNGHGFFLKYRGSPDQNSKVLHGAPQLKRLLLLTRVLLVS